LEALGYPIHLAFFIGFYALLGVASTPLIRDLRKTVVFQGALAACGGYGAVLASKGFGLPLIVAPLCGALLSAIFCATTFVWFSKIERERQVIASLAIQLIFTETVINGETLTGGALGIANIGIDADGGRALSQVAIVCVVWASVAAALAYVIRLRKGSNGIAMRLVGTDLDLAQSLGINAAAVTNRGVAVLAIFSGLGGALYAIFLTFVDPASFALSQSVFVLAVTISAGTSSPLMVVLSSAGLILLPELLRQVVGPGILTANARQLLFGLLLIASVHLDHRRSLRELARAGR